MTKLILITGAPGTGKTAVCRHLFETTPRCAWLDADWCWMINPWQRKTADQKRYTEETIIRILRGYLGLGGGQLDVVLLSWVMSSPQMLDAVEAPLADLEPEVHRIALVCSPEVHRQRMCAAGRRPEQADSPLPAAPYYQLGAVVLDVTNLSIAEAAQRVQDIVGIGGQACGGQGGKPQD